MSTRTCDTCGVENAATPTGDGPALVYRHSDGQIFTFIDRVPVGSSWVEERDDDAHRERLICRALLTHALALLDGESVA